MKTYIQNELKKLEGKFDQFYMRSRLKNYFGKWYFEYIKNDKEWTALQDEIYVINEAQINSLEELEQFMNEKI